MRRGRDDGRGDNIPIFGGLDKFINLLSDMVDNDKNEMNLSGDIKPKGENKVTGKYGINIKLGAAGAGGIDRIKSLNDVFDKNDRSQKAVEPVTDIFEGEGRATIVFELPNVEKKDIHLELDGSAVKVTAMGGGVCYSKRIVLKFVPDYKSVKENFSNSIYSLEIVKKLEEG